MWPSGSFVPVDEWYTEGMKELEVGAVLSHAWELFKKNPWMLIGVLLITFIVSTISSSLFAPRGEGGLLSIVDFFVQILISLSLMSFFLKAYENVEQVKIMDAWNPNQYLAYLGISLLLGIIMVVGYILLIVPGVIATVMFLAAPYLVVDKKMGPIEALKESKKLTEGKRMQLFYFVLAILGINLLGTLALGIGLFVSIPVSMLAMVHVYHTLERSVQPVPVA
jgi:uncharacterized membrane protein